jgi:hypothetical protein
MRWAKDKIENCCQKHENCKNYFIPPSQRRFRPTRLIAVNQRGAAVVHIVETVRLPLSEPLEYLALSHCWGESKIAYTLRRDTFFNALASGIRVDRLAKNFQHAIAITRGLGIGYLWIDSLCILQDSPNDLRWELATMGLLYATAKCTLSATASAGSAEGCFSTVEHFLGDCFLLTENDSSLVTSYRGTRESSVAHLFDGKVEDATITTRGWTFQERVLSSRVLHFCKGVVLFECNALQASSCNADAAPFPTSPRVRSDGKATVQLGPIPPPRPPLPSWPIPELEVNDDWRLFEEWANGELADYTPRHYTVESTYNLGAGYQALWEYMTWTSEQESIASDNARIGMRGAFEMLVKFQGASDAELLEFHNSWYELVARYSVRELTHETDKVVAIEGIAYFIETNTNFKFQFGLWAEHVKFTLLWHLEGESKKRPLRQMPTWSWVSVDGKIGHRLRSPSQKRPWKDITFLIEGVSVMPSAILQLRGCHLLSLSPKDIHFIADVHKGHSNGDKSLLCVPVVSFSFPLNYSFRTRYQIHGLVLERKNIDESGEGGDPASAILYERVGYFWVDDRKAIQDLKGKTIIRIS